MEDDIRQVEKGIGDQNREREVGIGNDYGEEEATGLWKMRIVAF
jgi:hypothetical protein